MTITVSDIVAGPFTGTGAPASLPFTWKTFTPEEIEVFTLSEGVETIIDPGFYTVTINRDAFNVVQEGGSVLYAGGFGAEIYLRAKPAMSQEQTWSDVGSRLRNLNEGLDRAVLRDLRAKYDLDQGTASVASMLAEVQDIQAEVLEDIANAPNLVGNKLDRTGVNRSPQLLDNLGLTPATLTVTNRDLPNLTDIHALNTGYAGTTQSMAPSEATRSIYLLQEPGATGVIYQFRMDGPYGQRYKAAMLPSAAIDHQGLSCQVLANSTDRLWTSARGFPACAQYGSFVDGGAYAPSAVFSFFTDIPGIGGYCIPTVSADQRLLFVRGRIGTINYIRGFRLSDLDDAGGDHTGLQIYDFTYNDVGNLGFQNMACDGQVLVLSLGTGTSGNPVVRNPVFTLTGAALSDGSFAYTLPEWSEKDGGGLTTRSEPEGIAFWRPSPDAPVAAHALIVSGDSGDAVTRIYRIGKADPFDADVMADRIILTMEPAPTRQHSIAIRETCKRIVAGGFHKLLGGLYMLAAPGGFEGNQRLLNWMDPGVGNLALEGSVTITPNVGVTSLVGGSYLIPYYTAQLAPLHYRDTAHVGVRVLSSAPTGGEVFGVDAGGYTRIYPRDGSNNAQTRCTDSAASNNTTGITDAQGYCVVTRKARTTYYYCRNGIILNTIEQASTKPPASAFRFMSSACTATVQYLTFGYHLTKEQQMALQAILDDFAIALMEPQGGGANASVLGSYNVGCVFICGDSILDGSGTNPRLGLGSLLGRSIVNGYDFGPGLERGPMYLTNLNMDTFIAETDVSTTGATIAGGVADRVLQLDPTETITIAKRSFTRLGLAYDSALSNGSVEVLVGGVVVSTITIIAGADIKVSFVNLRGGAFIKTTEDVVLRATSGSTVVVQAVITKGPAGGLAPAAVMVGGNSGTGYQHWNTPAQMDRIAQLIVAVGGNVRSLVISQPWTNNIYSSSFVAPDAIPRMHRVFMDGINARTTGPVSFAAFIGSRGNTTVKFTDFLVGYEDYKRHFLHYMLANGITPVRLDKVNLAPYLTDTVHPVALGHLLLAFQSCQDLGVKLDGREAVGQNSSMGHVKGDAITVLHPTFADNAAAIAGGLAAGEHYRTSAGVVMQRY